MITPPKPIGLFGASGHAKVIIDMLERTESYDIQGLFDDNEALWGHTLLDYPIMGGKRELYQKQIPVIVAIGQNQIRFRLAQEFAAHQIEFRRAIHPKASISRNVRIDAGTVVMAGVVINADATIRAHVIVNTGASVDHDCVIGTASHIAPGAHLCGGVTVGARTLIGAGATVIPNITIGDNVVIGAGATVISDIPDGVLALGTPARIADARKKS